MKAITTRGASDIDAPNVFEDTDMPLASPGRLDLQVRIDAVAVNPVDTKIRAGALGAALASALVVTVYEGGVVLANDHGSVEVEAGQVAFILVTLSLFYLLRLLGLHVKPWMRPIPAYTIGSFASLWFLQRCVLIFG